VSAPAKRSEPRAASGIGHAFELNGHALKRGYRSRRARVLSLIPVYLLLYPFVRALELFGRWPAAMSRGMARMMAEAEAYSPNEHDVMVCSYFKSGTNWTMQLVTQIAHRGKAEFDHIHDIVPWLELPARVRYTVPLSDESTWRRAPTGLRAVKTHLPFDKLTCSPSARYIWVVRDPKDVFVSSYRFVKSTVLGPLMPSVKRWLDTYLSPNTFIGSWAAHLDGGWRQRHRDNVLFLTFEEMKSDLRGTVTRIAEFMGVDLTPDELENVVRRSSFDDMKAHSGQFDTRGLSPPWATPRGAMVRRGRAGSADELLSADDQQRIDDYWRQELLRLGSDFPYDEAFG
jgi:hypothetical protein